MRDLSDGHQHASGKQRLHRGGIWYTAQSGIWQTVWLEAVPRVHVERLTLVPHLDDGCVEVTVHASGRRHGTVTPRRPRASTSRSAPPPGSRSTTSGRGRPTTRTCTTSRWSLGEDRVTSYVGMRSFGVGRDEHGTPRLLLNGTPYLPVGVLDQGYWPDGLLTAPSDAALVHDIMTMKDLGFTLLRKHLKVEPLRWYHHCDRLGMLVWQDLPNGGGRYRTAAVTWPGRYPIRLDDTRRRGPMGRADADGRALFERELRRTVELLRDVVSLMAWVPFNEGWGQFDARRVAAELARPRPDPRRRPRQRLARPGRRRPAQPALLPRPVPAAAAPRRPARRALGVRRPPAARRRPRARRRGGVRLRRRVDARGPGAVVHARCTSGSRRWCPTG